MREGRCVGEEGGGDARLVRLAHVRMLRRNCGMLRRSCGMLRRSCGMLRLVRLGLGGALRCEMEKALRLGGHGSRLGLGSSVTGGCW